MKIMNNKPRKLVATDFSLLNEHILSGAIEKLRDTRAKSSNKTNELFNRNQFILGAQEWVMVEYYDKQITKLNELLNIINSREIAKG